MNEKSTLRALLTGWRGKNYTEEDFTLAKKQAEAAVMMFVDAMAAGLPADSPAAAEAAEAHRAAISDWYYDCSYDMQVGLAEMYLADSRFSQHYEDYKGGLAQYVHDAIIANAIDKVSFKGQIKDKFAATKVAEAQKEVNKWRSLDPAEYHTPEGMDALKQKIGGILESIPYEQKTARSAIQDICNSTRKTVANQAPTYAKVMSDYSEASEQIREIEKALSLGNRASADTALRKLQSITRNNVSTNYGQRLNLAQQLEQEGGKPFISGLAGQALSSPTARGLAGAGELATLLSSFYNPSVALALPFQTPKLVGMGLYKAGQVGEKLARVAKPIGANATNVNTLSSILNAINRTKED